MKVFEVDVDVNNVQTLEYEDSRKEVKQALQFYGESKSHSWVAPQGIYVKDPHTIKSDVTSLGATNGFVLNERVNKILSNMLSPICEIFPIKVGNETMYLVNILSKIDCLDYNKSQFSYVGEERSIEKILFVEKYFFDYKKFTEDSIFRLIIGKKKRHIRIFCYDGVKNNPEHEFKYLVTKHNITGFKFTLVWDSEVS